MVNPPSKNTAQAIRHQQLEHDEKNETTFDDTYRIMVAITPRDRYESFCYVLE